FEQVRTWYGNNASLKAPTDPDPTRFTAPTFEGLFCPPVLTDVNDVPVLPTLADYDLGMSQPTHFAAFRVYVPWVGCDRRASLPPDYAITGVLVHDEADPQDLDFSRFLRDDGSTTGLASLVGPNTADTNGFLPVNQALPYTVHFQNDPRATTHVAEVRVVTQLDPALDARTFRLGDVRIGDVDVHVPAGRGVFQTEIDFTATKGYVLRLSAGIDLKTGTATWLLQAIDPVTGELVQD